MESGSRVLVAGMVVAVATGLLAVDLSVAWLSSSALEALDGWMGWVLVPGFVAALIFGWVLGRFSGGRLDGILPWSIVLFLVLRVGLTMGGWGHGDAWIRFLGVVLMPLTPALGYWLGYRWATLRRQRLA